MSVASKRNDESVMHSPFEIREGQTGDQERRSESPLRGEAAMPVCNVRKVSPRIPGGRSDWIKQKNSSILEMRNGLSASLD